MTLAKDKKYDIVFKAIKKDDKLNSDKQGTYSIITKNESHYIVLDKELDGYELYQAILKHFKGVKN